MHFWSLHFRSFFDLIHKLILLLDQSLNFLDRFKMVPTVNSVMEKVKVANGASYLLT